MSWLSHAGGFGPLPPLDDTRTLAAIMADVQQDETDFTPPAEGMFFCVEQHDGFQHVRTQLLHFVCVFVAVAVVLPTCSSPLLHVVRCFPTELC